MIRYVDDLVILCSTEDHSRQAERLVRNTLAQEYGLMLSDGKTHHVEPHSSLTFLGHTILPDGRIMPTTKRVAIVRDHVFSLIAQLPGKADHLVVNELASYLLGYFISMRHCDFTDDDYKDSADTIREGLRRRGLDPNRLTRQLRQHSSKWPPSFAASLP